MACVSRKSPHRSDTVECPFTDCQLFCFVFFPQDIDIKKVNGVPQYAFLQYCDIASVCKAIKKMDGEYLGNNRLKVKKSSHGLHPSCSFPLQLHRIIVCLCSIVYGSKMFFNE